MDSTITLASAVCLAASIVTVGYAAWCYIRPFTPCRYCRTRPRRRVSCTRCHASGYRLRATIRLLRHLARHRRHLDQITRERS